MAVATSAFWQPTATSALGQQPRGYSWSEQQQGGSPFPTPLPSHIPSRLASSPHTCLTEAQTPLHPASAHLFNYCLLEGFLQMDCFSLKRLYFERKFYSTLEMENKH